MLAEEAANKNAVCTKLVAAGIPAAALQGCPLDCPLTAEARGALRVRDLQRQTQSGQLMSCLLCDCYPCLGCQAASSPHLTSSVQAHTYMHSQPTQPPTARYKRPAAA